MRAVEWVLRVALLSMVLVAPHARAAYAIGPDISGTFYDPAQAGQGFIVEHTTISGTPVVVASWFTYLDGRARWLGGSAPATGGNEVRIPLVISSGGDFPPRFVASGASIQPWGELTLRFDDVDHGRATWTTTQPGFNNGEMPLTRLSTVANGGDSAVGRLANCHSGTWYDATQPGHGVFVEVLGSGANRQMIAVWYAYLNGEQRWMTAAGPITGDRAQLSATITRGAQFPPAFRASDVISEPWGTMTFIAQGANSASWQWSSTQPGFGSGTLALSRLTTLTGRDCGPESDAQASRFLTQSTFGPTTTSIAQVRASGYAGWIEAQRALTPTLQRPTVEQQIAAQVLVDPRNGPFYRSYRVERWFNTAVNAPDQLRQRVAFALSQILVVSDVGVLDNNPIGVAEYNDILLRNAFGNYRQLLREVTRSPAMGAFLTLLRNQKTDWTLDSGGALVPGVISPDENFAREVMQLFSIGLIERNRDFSPLLINGQTVPTYSQAIITDTAKVLTGLSFACTGPATVSGVAINRNCGTCVGAACNFSTNLFFATPPRYAASGSVTALTHPDTYKPMVCYPRYADTGRSATSANNYAVLPAPNDSKRLIAGITVPPSTVACYTATPGVDQQACIAYCDDQIETLITALYLHPNVAPFMARQLIQRLTTSNPSPAYIARVAGVFENDGTGTRGNLGAVVEAVLLDPEPRNPVPPSSFGKLREPLLRLTALWRAFGALPGSNGAYGLTTPERAFAQRPLGAPSVFNFYEPDYQQPGELADAGMYSPEFQILDESTVIATSDEVWRRVFSGYTLSGNGATTFATPANAGYLPPTVIDALPADSAGLVEALNQRLLNGAMRAATRDKLIALVETGMTGADKRRKALNLIHLIAISPEYALQR